MTTPCISDVASSRAESTSSSCLHGGVCGSASNLTTASTRRLFPHASLGAPRLRNVQCHLRWLGESHISQWRPCVGLWLGTADWLQLQTSAINSNWASHSLNDPSWVTLHLGSRGGHWWQGISNRGCRRLHSACLEGDPHDFYTVSHSHIIISLHSIWLLMIKGIDCTRLWGQTDRPLMTLICVQFGRVHLCSKLQLCHFFKKIGERKIKCSHSTWQISKRKRRAKQWKKQRQDAWLNCCKFYQWRESKKVPSKRLATNSIAISKARSYLRLFPINFHYLPGHSSTLIEWKH